MVKNLKKKIALFAGLTVITALLSGCESDECVRIGKAETGTAYEIFYGSKGKDCLESYIYYVPDRYTTTKEIFVQLVRQLRNIPDEIGDHYDALENVSFYGNIYNNVLEISYSSAGMDKVMEYLFRESIVFTMTQIKGIDYVTMLRDGQYIKDSKGEVITRMTSSDYTDYDKSIMNDLQNIELQLYYSNEAGDKLIGVKDTYRFNSKKSVEGFLVDRLVEKPEKGGMLNTLQSKSVINKIYTYDGVCYVDFSGDINDMITKVKPEVVIYSVVNSLTSINGINKVKITIDGSQEVKFLNTVPLWHAFSRNLNIIQN